MHNQEDLDHAADLLIYIIVASNQLDKAVSEAAKFVEQHVGLDCHAMRASQALHNKKAANEALELRAIIRELEKGLGE